MDNVTALKKRVQREQQVKAKLDGFGSVIPESEHTALMKLLELRFGKSIDMLVGTGSLRQVSRRLGVNFVTILHWRRKLKLYENSHSGGTSSSPTS